MKASIVRLGLFALATMLVPTVVMTPVAAVAQGIEPGTNGRNVRQATHDLGSFVQLGDGSWEERDINGRPSYFFIERARDDWSVYIYDRSRDTELQIDIHRRMIAGAAGRAPRQDLYRITDASFRSIAERWPSPGGGRRPDGPRGEEFNIDAGPIWNQADADQKCPALAYRAGGSWSGHWSTVVPGRMSVCQIRLRRER